MPLTKETRYLLEVALINYLRTRGEATSSEIYEHLKLRGFLAIKGIKQVSMLCRSFEKKGVLLSRKPNLTNTRPELRKIYRIKKWRTNPNFYKEHHRSMFTIRIPIRNSKEGTQIRKKRLRAIR